MASHKDDIRRLQGMHEGLIELTKGLNEVIDQLLPLISRSQFIYAKIDRYEPQNVDTSYECTVDSIKSGTKQLLATVFDADEKLWNANQHTLVLIEEVENVMTECRHLDGGETTPMAPSTPTAPNVDWKQ